MEPSPWAWNPGWVEIVATIVLALAYARSLRRYPASTGRVLAFSAGILLVLAAFTTPLQTLATNYLLSAHLVQNVVLAEWAPALVVVGLAPAAAARLGEIGMIRFLTRPYVALPVWIGTYLVWHVPVIYDAALRHQGWLLPIEHACYFAAGLAFWWPVLQDAPHHLRSGIRAVYVFIAFLVASPLGLLMALLPSPLYDFYESALRIWGISAIRDQQVAGMIMSGAEAVVFFAVFAVYFLRFLAEEDGQKEARAPISR